MVVFLQFNVYVKFAIEIIITITIILLLLLLLLLIIIIIHFIYKALLTKLKDALQIKTIKLTECLKSQ